MKIFGSTGVAFNYSKLNNSQFLFEFEESNNLFYHTVVILC